ncbi:MAG: DMT family transporter [Patescibacteria group bacterium]|nr:MAG: DMT family transporter [Patescibacteria group bacterium]
MYKGILSAIAGFFFFSSGDVIAKLLSKDGYDPFQISFLYALVAALLLLACSKSLGGVRATFATRKKALHVLRGVLQAPTQALVFYAIARLPLSTAYAVIFLAPFLTAALAVPVLKERATVSRWMLIAAGFAGVLVALRPDTQDMSWAIVAVAVVACSAAARNVLVVKMGPQETPLSLALFPSAAIVVFSALPAMHGWTPLTSTTALAMLVGGVAFGAGLLLTALAFRYAPVSVAAPFHYTQIIWGVLAGMVLFGNPPDVWTLVGCGIIVLSGIALVRLRRPSSQAPVRAEAIVSVP